MRSRYLIVQSHTPTRRAVALAAFAVLLLIGLYLTFELGRRSAGFDILESRRERGALQAEVQRINQSVVGLRAQAAELENVKAGQARERAEVSRTIGELQAQLAKQTQELTFYKGLVVQGPNTPEVKVQQLRILPGTGPRSYVVRLTLVQPRTTQNQVSGTVLLSVAGQTGDRTDTLDLARLTAGRLREQAFTLRYFENLQFDLTLPEGFRPQRLQLEARSSRRGVTALVQSYLWSVEAN